MCHFGIYLYPILTLQFNILTAVRSMRQFFYVCYQSILMCRLIIFYVAFFVRQHFFDGCRQFDVSVDRSVVGGYSVLNHLRIACRCMTVFRVYDYVVKTFVGFVGRV